MRILLDILEYIHKKSYRTETIVICTMCREISIPYVRLKKIFAKLERNGHMEIRRVDRTFDISLTDSGLQLLNCLREIKELLEKFEIEL